MISAPRFFALCIALFPLASCGLKGPLYFPPPEPVEGQQPMSDATVKPKSVSMKSQQQKNQTGSQDAPAQTPQTKGASQPNPASPTTQ